MRRQKSSEYAGDHYVFSHIEAALTYAYGELARGNSIA
jgi:hypothetical protein